MQGTRPDRVVCAGFEFDLRSGELRGGGRTTRLAEKPYRLLALLVEHDGELVTREEIQKKLWPNDTIVDFEHSINSAIKVLRRAFGDSADSPKYIETIPRHGYRMMVPVERVGAAFPALPDEGDKGQVPAGAQVRAEVSPGTGAVLRRDLPAALTGRAVSHYRVLNIIGGGGMGVVYRAEDLKLGRQVALKFLPEELGGDPQALERFSREAHAASSLDHPNICDIHEFGEHEGRPFIVMQLLEGQTLRDHLAALAADHKALPVERLLDIAIQTAEGLQAAHDKGIIHRDIKPANIFLTSAGQVKILDFGLAKLVASDDRAQVATASGVMLSEERSDESKDPYSRGDLGAIGVPQLAAPTPGPLARDDTLKAIDPSLTRTGIAMGTAGYMSPEQVRGEKLDARTDLFCFGLVLYEMATGERAFGGETAAVVRDATLNQSPIPLRELNSTLPAKLVSIIDRALEKDRERRWQSAAEMRADLQALMPSGRIVAPWSSRTWTVAAVVTLLVLAMVSAIIYRRLASTHAPHVDVQNMKMASVTDHGMVRVAAISPDGRYVAYSLQEARQSLWIQQVATESKAQVVPPSVEELKSVSYSPDSNYLYFVRNDRGYVIPALGGTPTLITKNIYGGIGVSPDGRKLAFVRGADTPKSQLIVVNQDGSDERIIGEYPRESGTRFFSREPPSWSPDGRLIAITAIRKADCVLNLYPAEGGSPKVISLPGTTEQALWLPDQSGLLLTIASSYTAPLQIWLQPFPKGSLQRLTNDLDSYMHLSLSADAKLLAALRMQFSFTMFVGPSSTPNQGTAIQAGRSEGLGLAWMRDGTILSQSRKSEFSSLTPDGKRRVSLFKEEVYPGAFSICKDGRFLIVEKLGLGEHDTIWRMDLAGHSWKQLTEGPMDTTPNCSPDAQSVIYLSRSSKGRPLMKVPIAGGVPSALSDAGAYVEGLEYSPDGREIADIERDHKPLLVLRNARTGQITKVFSLPTGFDVPLNIPGILHWTADGRAVTYVLQMGGTVNLWSQPLSGGPPHQITNFPDAIFAYDWSPDGKQLALTRLAQSRDVVLISSFH